MELFTYTFFQYALLGALLSSVVCGIVGTYVVSRRLVFISGGITHASFGGVGIGLYTGCSPLLSAGIFSTLCAIGVQWLGKRKEMREDSAIAVFWTLGMAVGILFSYLTPGYAPDLSDYLFGNILTVGKADLVLQTVVAIFVVAFFSLYLRPIVHMAFDPVFARAQGLPVAAFDYLMMVCIALSIVSCLHMVGIVLVLSLLTIPQMTANIFTRSFVHIMWLSVLIGFVSCVLGLFVSYYLSTPSGASIIFCAIIIYACCKFLEWCRNRWHKNAT